MVSPEVTKDAVPSAATVELPRLVLPSLNCTVPVVVGLTIAINVAEAFGGAVERGDVVSAVLVRTFLTGLTSKATHHR